MNPDIFSEWLRRQGQQVFRTPSSYWHSQGPRVYQAFPYHWVIQPDEDELTGFLTRNRALGLRYSTSLDAPQGCISYHAVYEKLTYGFETLGKWARKNVRRGLKNCEVQPISFPRLSAEGWPLQRDTLNRQGRHLPLPRETWQGLCLAAGELPGFEAWGALVQGRLAASVITFQMQDCTYLLYQQCLKEYLPAHVNNALSFSVTMTMVQRPDIHSILYGLHSLDAPGSVDEFKFRMGYTPKPVRQRVVFHPWLSPMFTPVTRAVVAGLHRARPGSPFLAKTEGMIRFYLEGQRPLALQSWPACLVDSLPR
jgi:hypothetical protein